MSMKSTIEQFRQFVREFADKEIAPLAADIDRNNEFPTPIWNQLGQAKLLGLTIPKKFGGTDKGYLAHLVAMEEISRASASVGLSYCAHSNLCLDNLFRNANTVQRDKYLPKLCTGEWVGALAMSEQAAGSDVVGSMSCYAEQNGDFWIANGSKKWITNGPDADVYIVYMRTNTGIDSGTITAFIVERTMRGFSVGNKTDKLGVRGSNTCELFFEDCKIPHENALGEINKGVKILMSGLDSERLILSGGPLGIMQSALEVVLPYVKQRKQFNKPIGTFELMQGKLADMYTALHAARSFSYDTAEQFDKGIISRKDAAACYLFASEAAVKVSLEAIQCLGAPGYMNDSTVSRLVRDAKVYDIGGGTNEIRRMLIGRELFEEK